MVGDFAGGRATLLAASALLCVPVASGSSSCWVAGYSRELCCDVQHGPLGNSACWDDLFRYDPCCTTADALEPGSRGGAPGAEPEAAAGPPSLSREALLLERSLGPKLDGTLAENNSTLAALELDLRRTIDAPENRSMAGPATHAYLALVLYRQGRGDEAAAQFQQFLANDFSISANGVWVGSSAEGYHMHDVPFSAALVGFLRERGARTVADFGCGLGLYVRDLRAAGLRASGFDGNPATTEITGGRCQQLDLSREVDFGTRWDWVLSLEVAEHIPKELEESFLGNLERHACLGMVLSWGNQAGEGHVNLRPRGQVEALFAARGFRSEPVSAAALRGAARLPWLQNTVLVFDRIAPPADCSGAGSANVAAAT